MENKLLEIKNQLDRIEKNQSLILNKIEILQIEAENLAKMHINTEEQAKIEYN